MTDRPLPPGRHVPPAAAGFARAPARSGASTSSSGSVRRNLFQSQLTRRPTPSSSSTSTETLRLDAAGSGVAAAGGVGSGAVGGDAHSDSSDIVIRDKNGEVELGDPPTPPVDDADEVVLDPRQENEKERQRLADAVKQHRIDQNSVPAQPEELLEAVRASLRAKVAALVEDNWMYEREDIPRHQ